MSWARAQSSVSQFAGKGTILVAADNRALGGWVTETLRRTGYLVRIAPNGADSADISFVGVQLAILAGSNCSWIEGACATVRHRARNLALMVLGPDNFDTRVRSFEIGADAYLVEPFAREEILARITSLIRIYQRSAS